MTDQGSILQSDFVETDHLRMRVMTEAPTEGVTWHEGYSDPYLVVNFRAQLQEFDVAADGGEGYRGLVVPGDFSFLPPGASFGGYYIGAHMCYACITFPKERLNPRFADSNPIIMRSDPMIRTLAEALYAQRHRNGADVAFYRESLAEALLQHLQLIHLNPSSSSDKPQHSFDRLDHYIRANLDQKLTVAELATVLKISPQSLQRLVRKQLSLSVYEWVTTLRLERSLELLRHSTLDLVTIAIESGFANQSHWTRLFRRQFGVSPGKIRQR